MSNPHWPLQSNCARLFGNPSHLGFAQKNLVRVVPPFKMHMGDIHIDSFYVNKICAKTVEQWLERIWEACGKDQERLAKENMDKFSGAWAVRTMRGSHTTSMHAYGLAIDFNAAQNPLGVKPHSPHMFTNDSMPVKFAKEAGIIWGGDWHGRPDAMHFRWPSWAN